MNMPLVSGIDLFRELREQGSTAALHPADG